MSGHRRQLSDAGALLLSLFVFALFIGASILFFFPFAVLSPVLLSISLCMLGFHLVRYPFRRRIELSHPAPLILAGWSVVLPLAGLLVPLLDAVVLAAPRIYPRHRLGDHLEFVVWLSGVVLVQLSATLLVWVRTYVRTPVDVTFEGELPRKGLGIALLSFSLQFLGLTFCLAGPLAGALGAVLLARHGESFGPVAARVFLHVGATPALVMGLALIRRGFWILEIQRLVDDHPRSSVRGAALGLVELGGRALPLEGAHPEAAILLTEETGGPLVHRVSDFVLDDGTGRVVVRVPPKAKPGVDGVLDLTKRSTPAGLQREHRLMPGDSVYVLGELVATAQGRELRPWTPPFGRFLAGLTRDFFDQDWSFGGGVDFGQALDLRLHPEVFALTDAGEDRLRRLTRRRWIGSLALGLLLIAGAAVFLARLPA